MKKRHLIFLSSLAGLLLSAAWPARGFPGLLFIGLVPLLLIEDHINRNREKYTGYGVLFYTFPAFLIWNGLTTWWIVNSTGIGAALAIILNSLFMSIVFQLFHYSGKRFSAGWIRYLILICFWMSFEYLHLNWSLNWPWLNLGNGFASYYKWVQWYEYTGAFGGTLWVLLTNLFLFFSVRKFISKPEDQAESVIYIKSSVTYLISWLLLIIIPVCISLIIYATYEEKKDPVKFVVVQPNIDPYNEQYVMPPAEVVGRIMALAGPHIDSTTNFLIAPESAIQEYMSEADMPDYSSMILLKTVIDKYPRLNMIVGASTQHIFKEGEPRTVTARKFTDADLYYDPFNTAIMINATGKYQLYHKSKLTPGVESLPTLWGWNILEKFAIDLGGTVGSIGTDKVRKVYTSVGSCKISPAICYESIFGEFFAEFVRNGAQIMVIITNDGWWGNTPGHRQHYSFAHLRAIETRRDIARSANTGISSFIDQRGDDSQVTAYWVPAVITGTLNANSTLTFYVKHGDYLAAMASWVAGIFFLIAIFESLRKRGAEYKKLRNGQRS